MKKQSKLALLFNVRAGEARPVVLLFARSFFLGAVQTLAGTSAATLFLEKFTPDSIPYVYIGAAIIAPLAGVIHYKFAQRVSFTMGGVSSLLLLLLIMTGFLALTAVFPETQWLPMVFFIWFFVQDAFIYNEFWALVDRLFDLRQAKRLSGLIGMGDMLARIITGYSISYLIEAFGSVASLLRPAIGGLVLSLILMVYLSYAQNLNQAPKQSKKEQAHDASSYRDILKNRYILMIISLALITLLAYYFVDINFITQVRIQYPTEDALAAFLGTFEATVYILTALIGLFLAGPLSAKFGVRGSLLSLPLMAGIGVILMVSTGTMGQSFIPIFIMAALTKLLFTAFRMTTHIPAYRVLIYPLLLGEQDRTHTLIEVVAEPAIGGIAGFVLLKLPSNVALFSSILLGVIVLWIILVIALSRDYARVLKRAINLRMVGGVAFSIEDATSMELVRRGLESPHPGEVSYFLDVLENAEYPDMGSFLKRLLAHQSPELRLDVLQRAELLGEVSIIKEVSRRLEDESSAQVKGAVLRTLAGLGEADVIEKIVPYLQDPDEQVRMGAVVGLLRSGGIEGILEAGKILLRQIESLEVEERRAAARTLGEVGIANFYRPLLGLLKDDDRGVRREALAAAGKLRNPKLWPLVLENLEASGVRERAAAALVAGGEGVLPELERVFAKKEHSSEMFIRTARVCGRIGGETAIRLLKEQIRSQDMDVRHEVLASLRRCGYSASLQEVSGIIGEILSEVKRAAWTLAVMADIGEDGTFALVRSALSRKLDRHHERIFYLLSFIYDQQTIIRAGRILKFTHATGEKRAVAMEIIDVLLSIDLKKILLPLLENLPLIERLRRLGEVFPYKRNEPAQRFQEIVITGDQLLNPWIKATALWTLKQLDQDEYREHVSTLQGGDKLLTGRILHFLENEIRGDIALLSVIEKLIILKTVSIFSGVPDEVLAELAASLDELEYQKGQVIFEKGDIGTSMYIIISGQVLIHDGEREIARRGDRDVIGEMSLLDPEPRSASATAVTDLRMLRLEEDLFYDLMADRIEITRGIIHILIRRLRESS